MEKERFDISKDGLKTSLLTFISGHATSLIVVAFLVTAFYFPVFGTKLKDKELFNFCLPVENKVIFTTLIFLLLHPFGLMVDVLGWILLGWMEKYVETIHFKYNIFINKGTKNYLCFETLKKELQLTPENFYEQTRQKEYILITRHPDINGELDFYLGSSILFRNLTICSLIIAFIYLYLGLFFNKGLIVLFISFLFVIVNSCVSFYYSLSVLMIFSKLSEKNVEKNCP